MNKHTLHCACGWKAIIFKKQIHQRYSILFGPDFSFLYFLFKYQSLGHAHAPDFSWPLRSLGVPTPQYSGHRNRMENSVTCLLFRFWLAEQLSAQSPKLEPLSSECFCPHCRCLHLVFFIFLLDCYLNILERDPSVTSFFPCTPFSTLLLEWSL